MSVNKILKYNRRSSKKLGWEPEWFGCDNIDEDLINKVKEFQQEFDLDVDGYVGPATHRRLLLEREDDDEQRSQNRNHHQSKQGNGQPKNDRPFPDVFIDFEPFHLYNDSY